MINASVRIEGADSEKYLGKMKKQNLPWLIHRWEKYLSSMRKGKT